MLLDGDLYRVVLIGTLDFDLLNDLLFGVKLELGLLFVLNELSFLFSFS